jgi:hypothetical protein
MRVTRRMAVKPDASVNVSQISSAMPKPASVVNYRPEGQSIDEGYSLPIRSITLTTTIADGSAINELSLDDACGILPLLGIGAGATNQKLEVKGSITASALKNYLQSYKMRISEINYECVEDSTQLDNKIKFYSGSLDERIGTPALFDTAVDKRNTQFQTTLQTVFPSSDAWLTNVSGIVVPTSSLTGSTKTVSLTLKFDKIMAY